MALSPEDASFVCGQFGIDIDRPLIARSRASIRGRTPSGRDPTPIARSRKRCPKCSWRWSARWHRRPRGLGVLPEDLRVRGLRPRHQDPSTTSTTSVRSRSRVSVAVDVLLQKSDPRGFRIDGHRGAVEVRPVVAGNVAHPDADLRWESGSSSTLSRGRAAQPRDPRRPTLGKFLGRKAGSTSGPTPDAALLRDWLEMFTDLEV